MEANVKVEFVDCETTELLACRVCLSTDAKLFNIFKYNLNEIFSNFVGASVSKLDKLPQHICNMCGAMLLKSEAFRARCRKTQFFLQEMLAWKPHQLTTKHFQTLDSRTEFQIPLVKTNTLKLELSPEDNLETDEIHEVSKNVFENSDDPLFDLNRVKMDIEEHSPELTNEQSTIHTHTHNVNNITKTEETENSNDDLNLEEPETETEKKSEEKVAKSKKVKTKKITKPKPPKPKSKKRPCNIMFEEDYSDFSKMYEVDVIYLSREQQLQELNAGKEISSFQKSRFKCTMCYKGFMLNSVYKKHMKLHDPSTGDVECDICHLRYRFRKNLLLHIRRQHKLRFVCRRCGHRNKSSTSAKLHHRWHQGFKYTCSFCSKTFTFRKSCTNHEKDSHKETKCEECGENIAGLLALTVHKREHEQDHLTKAKREEIISLYEKNNSISYIARQLRISPYKCSKCPLGFQNKEALEKHQCNYSSCPTCGENFWGKQLLHQHMLKEHNVGVVCDECGLVWRTEESLKDHWVRMHREKNPADGEPSRTEYVCEVCAKLCKSAALLRNHQLTHSGVLPFACTLCEQRFRFKSSLQVHINTHTGAQPYKCHFCPETFKSYGQRYKHKLLVHTKERKHKCNLCEKAYKLLFDLKTHMRTAHLKIPLPKRKRGDQHKDQ